MSGRCFWLGCRSGNDDEGHRQDRGAERRVDEEDPPPVEGGDQQAAEGRVGDGARPATAPQMPSAAPRCSGGKTMVRIASVCGISIAASKPWTARKPISQPSAGAKPRAADAAVLTAISTTNMVRGPTGSPKSPRRDHQDSQRTSAYALSTQSTSSRDAPEPAARTSTPRNRILSGALGGGQLDHRSRSNVPLVILLRATL